MSDNWHGWIDGVEFTSRESALQALGISEPAPAEQGEERAVAEAANTIQAICWDGFPNTPDGRIAEKESIIKILRALLAVRPQPKDPQAEVSGEGAERTAITKEISNDN